MRLPCVSFAFIAGAFLQIILSAPVKSYACCAAIAETKSVVFEETKPEDVPPPALTSPLSAPTKLDVAVEKLADKESYADVFSMLREDTSCSRYFGGPLRAVEVLNQLARQLRRKSLGGDGLAIRMSGTYTIYRDARTGASYRLFEEAVINSNGPFAMRVAAHPWSPRKRIGRFPAQTREARALVLLHEMGHLIVGGDGKWLLPNDGNDSDLSDRNTSTVETKCIKQLLALEN